MLGGFGPDAIKPYNLALTRTLSLSPFCRGRGLYMGFGACVLYVWWRSKPGMELRDILAVAQELNRAQAEADLVAASTSDDDDGL